MGVTIKDVAKAAGVSISTVSKVINGHYSISEETQERVQQVIQELNFYPSASAQNFAAQRSSFSCGRIHFINPRVGNTAGQLFF